MQNYIYAFCLPNSKINKQTSLPNILKRRTRPEFIIFLFDIATKIYL